MLSEAEIEAYTVDIPSELQQRFGEVGTLDKSSFPPVLDACCGSRGFWFDKQDDRALFVDIRREDIVRHDSKRKDGSKWSGWTMHIQPDKQASFTDLPFPDATFALVVFDPPHMTSVGGNSRTAQQYGKLSGNWPEMLRKGFAECFSVLRPEGTLIFKWCEYDVPLADVLALTDQRPLFGHKSGKQQKTHWVAFLKSALTPSKTPHENQSADCTYASL